MSKKTNTAEHLQNLRTQLHDALHGFEKLKEYKKFQATVIEIEEQLTKLRNQYLEKHQPQIDQLKDSIKAIEIKMRAKSTLAHDPRIHGNEFLKFWDTLFFGTSNYIVKELIWVDEKKQHCLVKIPSTHINGYSKVAHFLIRIQDNKLLYSCTGRFTWVRRTAAEEASGIAINL